mmetsp:Transcript_36581/g.114212  ORF Transcript_36581/g.114212 Transcript_36581/m.114212 type:complete len:161 (-) Transcript_36581:124-606(-)
MLDLLAEVGLGGLLHLGEDHGRDLLGREGLGLALVLGLDVGLAVLGDYLEGEVLQVVLEGGVVHLAADEALGVEDCVVRVHGGLVFGGIADEALAVGEGNPGGGRAVTLVVCDDLAALLLPDADAGVGSAEVDANGGSVDLLVRHGRGREGSVGRETSKC